MSEHVFEYQALAPMVKKALVDAFPNGTFVDVSEGYRGRVDVVVVSEGFSGRSEREKQELVWDVIRRELDAEAQGVGLVVTYETEDLI